MPSVQVEVTSPLSLASALMLSQHGRKAMVLFRLQSNTVSSSSLNRLVIGGLVYWALSTQFCLSGIARSLGDCARSGAVADDGESRCFFLSTSSRL